MPATEERRTRMGLVCFAVKEEARFFRPPASSRLPVKVVITGMGRKNAERAIKAALDEAVPEFVLTCGFAGGLDPALKRGSLLFSADEESPLSTALLALGVLRGTFHCAGRVAVTVTEKRQLRETTRADAVEMESEIIRHICTERGVPSATLRVVSDAADEDLPVDFNSLMTARHEIDFLKLIALLLRSPGTIPALLRLQKHTTQAAKSLAECLGALLTRIS
jgi:nucleoside phosphorylase